MSKNVGDLIAQLTLAESQLTALISQDSQPSHSELSKLDNKLNEAFEALVTAPLHDVSDHLERISFLISHVRKLTDQSNLIDRILDQIEKDVAAIANTGADTR